MVGVAGGACLSSGAELQGLTTGVLGDIGVVGSTWDREPPGQAPELTQTLMDAPSPPTGETNVSEAWGGEMYLGSLQVDIRGPLLLGAPALPLVATKVCVSTLCWSGVQT